MFKIYHFIHGFICVLLISCSAECFAAGDILIDADYPGGNIAVERIEGDHVYLHQELRDTQGWWFYWNFRVRGAQNRKLIFHFSGKPVFDRQGPAISRDNGQSWEFIGIKSVNVSSFTYVFGSGETEMRFAFAPPYLESDLRRFLAEYENNRHLKDQELCQTGKGREVEQIHIGQLEKAPSFRILLTCRHHACESPASYVLEGVMEAMLSESEDGRWFRDNAEILVVPFMDKDGVEEGDQGKNRKPRDHNRDYIGESVHPSVAALRKLVPLWSEGKLTVAIDLHSPYIRDNKIFLVGSSNAQIWKEQLRVSSILDKVENKPLPYRISDNIPFGSSWNTDQNYKSGKSFGRWAAEIEGIRLATTIEIPYGNALESPVTPERARAFGGSLVTALRLYLLKLQ